MKNLIRFLVVSVLIFGYTSCDELTEVNLDQPITVTIPVTVSDGMGESVNISSSEVINIGDYINNDYLNKIETVRILSCSYEVASFSGDFAGVMSVDLMADNVILATHTGVTVSDEEGVMYTVDNQNLLSPIASNLKNANDITFAVSGTSINDGGMSFGIAVTLDLEIVADAL